MLRKIRDDLKHLHNTTEDENTKDFLKGMILYVNQKLLKPVSTDTEYGDIPTRDNSKESEIL